MTSMTSEQFREAVRTQYESGALVAQTGDVAAQLDESLRGTFARLCEKVLLLEALTLRLPTGDPATIHLMFRGEFDGVVETWQQSVLSRPRITIHGNDPEFRSKVINRYNLPCQSATAVGIANSLDEDLSSPYITFWELMYQLHLCAKELAVTRDPDLAAQTKQNLQWAVETWKLSLLNRPRARALEAELPSE